MIGNSVLELYIAEVCYTKVCNILDSKQEKNLLRYSKDLDRSSNPFNAGGSNNTEYINNIGQNTMNRIGFLLSRHDIKNLRTCIVDGYSDEIINGALLVEANIRMKRSQQNHEQSRTHDDE